MSSNGNGAEGEQIARTRAIVPPGPAGRMALAGMPVERSENFGASAKRLLGRMRPERAGAIAVLTLAVGSVTNSSIVDLWKSERYQTLRAAHLGGSRASVFPCNRCTVV